MDGCAQRRLVWCWLEEQQNKRRPTWHGRGASLHRVWHAAGQMDEVSGSSTSCMLGRGHAAGLRVSRATSNNRADVRRPWGARWTIHVLMLHPLPALEDGRTVRRAIV